MRNLPKELRELAAELRTNQQSHNMLLDAASKLEESGESVNYRLWMTLNSVQKQMEMLSQWIDGELYKKVRP